MIKLYCTLFILLSFTPFMGCVQNQHSSAQEETTTSWDDNGITAKKVKKLLDNNTDFTLIDTRFKKEYARSHLPSALSMPACEGNNSLQLLPEEKDQLLIFYCGWATCSMNTRAAAFVQQAGYTNIRFMANGVEGWIKAGFATTATDIFVQNGQCILLDLRASSKNTVQRIPDALSIPLPKLAQKVAPLSRKAVIVVYSDRVQDSIDALAQLQTAGFSNVSMVEGNFQGWKKRGKPITSGPIATTLNWQEKPITGEVTLLDFNNALQGKIDAVLLDVRTSEEVSTGKLQQTIHIPLEELASRKKELPKDKKIFIHCSSGSRADMAGKILRRNGYSSFALQATLKCKDGDCELAD